MILHNVCDVCGAAIAPLPGLTAARSTCSEVCRRRQVADRAARYRARQREALAAARADADRGWRLLGELLA